MRLVHRSTTFVPSGVSSVALGALVLVFGMAIAYARVRHAGFIWDDESHLIQNPVIAGPLGFAEIWTSARAVYYPLVLTTFWILHKFFGLNPLPYHLLNVTWHAASALVLWRVLVQLRVRGAWLGAAIWALHPVMVQSVAWVTEMKNTQSAFFYLLTICLFIRSRESKRSLLFYGLAIASFLAAITSKPSTVMLPVVLALCLWWRRDRVNWRDLRPLAPFLLISLAASAWTIWEQKFHAGARGAEWMQTPLQRLLISADVVWFYLFKLLWPHPLIFIYPRWNVETSRYFNYLPLIALVIVVAVLFLRRNRELRPVFFALSYFAITLFPVLDFFDVYFFRYSFVSDHFQYLPSIGPLALVGSALYCSFEEIIPLKVVRFALSFLLLAIVGTLTFHQTENYLDLITLYQATLARNPACWMADYNLGLALKERGDLDGAITHYRHAIATHPEYVEAHYNLAGALIQQGEIDEALAHYRRTIELKPDEADSHNNYGSALLQLGRQHEAEAEYRRALNLQPEYLDAQLNLASLLVHTRRSDEAVAQLRAATRVLPNSAAIHGALGNALLKSGQAEQATAEFEHALKLAPDDVPSLISLSWLLATSPEASARNARRAMELAEHANKIRGDKDPVVLHSLAAAYAEAGRFNEAISTAERASVLAEQQRNRPLLDALRGELSLYQLKLPYRQNLPAP